MYQALVDEAEKRSQPMAGIIRQAVSVWLASNGRPVESNVNWGGYREKATPAES
jgi:hypothetical protein